MHKLFVKTENYARFVQAIHAVERRGASESGMLLVYGLPGSGKSKVVKHWASETNALYLRASVDWTPRYFLTELAKVLGADPYGTPSALFSYLLERISENRLSLVIDEAEFTLPYKAAVLEKIREFSDHAETTVVLVGMESIRQKIAKHQQIFSRIAQVVEFRPVALSDVRQACQGLSEVIMSEALVAEVHRLCGGRMREALNVIAGIERVAKLNGLERVDVADLEGAALSYDWRNGTPKTVRQRQEAPRPVRTVRSISEAR